jgi:twinkle protein
MDWTDIERKLCEQPEAVCRHLLPAGKRDGAEYKVGSLSGEAGSSLCVNLAGKVGMWSDFAASKGGKTLMSLWCSVRSQPFKVCIVEAKQFLGIRDDFDKRVQSYGTVRAGGPSQPQHEDSAWKAVADVWAKCQPLTEGGPVWNYLVGQRRLEPALVELYQVREMLSYNRWVMVFPYFLPDEDDAPIAEVMQQRQVPGWLKFELLERLDGKKKEWTSKGPEKCLWGLQVARTPVFKSAQHVLICEGEKDALSWASYGANLWNVVPVSVPFGAKWRGQVKGQPSPNREWLDRCWDWLQGFETVFVAMDSDDAGRRAAADIIAEIGPRRCRLVELPEMANS